MNNEQFFLNYCREMERLAIPLFSKEMEKYGLTEFEVGQGIDFPGAPHPVGDAWLTMPYSIYVKTQNSKSGEDEIIQITICPAAGWKPILSVSSTSVDPVMFETTYSAEKDIALIQKQIEECFLRLKAG
jgi:hypothetical protein